MPRTPTCPPGVNATINRRVCGAATAPSPQRSGRGHRRSCRAGSRWSSIALTDRGPKSPGTKNSATSCRKSLRTNKAERGSREHRRGAGWLTAKVRREPRLARRFFDRFEPVHGVTYFAPEARAALDGLGYRGFWMGYFAARSAPLGIVPTEGVPAIFSTSAPERVARALPTAWQIAGPEAALRARQESAVAALRRYGLVADEKVSVAAQLAGKAARAAALDG